MADPSRPQPYRPGAVSLFFVAKAGVFAAGLLDLAAGPGAPHRLGDRSHVLAATGAVTTTLVAVVLGARMALQRNAAVRHAELKRLLVDISWNAFAAAGNAETPGKVVPFPTAPADGERAASGTGADRVSVARPQSGQRRRGRGRGRGTTTAGGADRPPVGGRRPAASRVARRG